MHLVWSCMQCEAYGTAQVGGEIVMILFTHSDNGTHKEVSNNIGHQRALQQLLLQHSWWIIAPAQHDQENRHQARGAKEKAFVAGLLSDSGWKIWLLTYALFYWVYADTVFELILFSLIYFKKSTKYNILAILLNYILIVSTLLVF